MLPTPRPGLVLRYKYFWSREAAEGHVEGAKSRPSAVVMVIGSPPGGDLRVLVLPITHSPPAIGVEAMEIPAMVARNAGMEASRSWIMLSEYNEFAWPGYDLDSIPGSHPRKVAYGYFSAGFFELVRARWLSLDSGRQVVGVSRDA